MGTVTNPLGGLLSGIVQGHALATQIKQQAMQQEAHDRAMADADREAQVKDIQTQMMLGQNARPVSAGTISESMNHSNASPVPGMPNEDTTVSVVRPVDKSRKVTYKGRNGQSQDYELYTPEEQMQRQTKLQASGASMLEDAKAKADTERSQQIRNATLNMQKGGVPAQGFADQGYPDGTPLTREEFGALQAKKAALRKENRFDSAPGHTTYEQGPDGEVKQVAGGGPPPLPEEMAPYLNTFAIKNGVTPDALRNKPENVGLMSKFLDDYSQRHKDPQAQAMMLQLHQAALDMSKERLAQIQEQRTTKSQPIEPGTREFKVAQDLAYGKLTMQQFRSITAYSRDTNKKMDIYDKAAELNPNFNPAQFEMGFKFAANPKTQQQLASIDNVQKGVGDLLKFSDQASRSGVTVLNKLIVPGGVAVGGKKYSNFHTAQIAFADELSGALGFGGATDMAKQMGFDMTNPNLSPENFRSAIQDVVVPFVERKRKSMLDQMGVYGLPGMNPGAPAQPAAGGTAMIRARDPQGNLHEAPEGTALPAGWKVQK